METRTNKKKVLSEEHKYKLRLAHLGKPNGCLGTKRSDESKRKMREARLAYYKKGNIPWNKGKNMSEEYREIMRKAQTGSKHLTYRDENHFLWKGDNASLPSIHIWVKRRKPKPEFCEECKIKPPRDLANISQEYKRDVNDFEWLCRKCHMYKDGRAKIQSDRLRNMNALKLKHA
jgi:hypothetical protein